MLFSPHSTCLLCSPRQHAHLRARRASGHLHPSLPQPLSHRHGGCGAQGLTATANAILSRSCQSLLLFAGLLDRARTDTPLSCLCITMSPPLVSLPCVQLTPEHPRDTCPAHIKRSRYSPWWIPQVGTKHQPLPDKDWGALLFPKSTNYALLGREGCQL